MTTLPDPPVPRECDCRGLDFPLRIDALLKSDFVALSTGDEFKAAMLLWAAAWENIPAASLPDDDRFLASKARLSLAEFRASREMIMHGFGLAADGLLYHEVIAGQALKAFKFRSGQKKKAADAWASRNAAASESARRGISPGINPEKRRGISPGTVNGMPGHGRTDAGAMPYIRDTQEPLRISQEEDPVASSLRSESTALDSVFEAFERDDDVDDSDAWKMAVGVLVVQGGLSDRRARGMVGKIVKEFGLSTYELAKVAAATRKAGTGSPEPYLRQVAASTSRDRGSAPARANDPGYWPVDVQRAWLEELQRSPLSWRPERGPAPGLTGCKVEPMLLAEFGFALGDDAGAFE